MPVVPKRSATPSFVDSLPLTVSSISFLQETGLLEIIKMQKDIEHYKEQRVSKRSDGRLTDSMVVKALWLRCSNGEGGTAARH